MRAFLGLLLCLLVVSPLIADDAVFPLKPARAGSYLEDRMGRPFLIAGDSAWSMIAGLRLDEAEFYLDTRKQQGFNTILTSLIEHEFAPNAPANMYGDPPFSDAAFEQPNDAYFDRAEAFIEAALRRNMLVLLCPAYLGAGGGPQGWYLQMLQAGPERLKDYGRYIGRRFAKYPNIIWLHGGDYDPPDKGLVSAVADGISEVNPAAVQTVHPNRDTVTHSFWKDAAWLDIDTVYTYDDVAAAVLARRETGPQRPFLLIEGRYEAEHGDGESEVRLVAYSALLSGAAGQMFGNNPVWHFSAGGLFEASQTWQQALSSPGARSITHLVGFLGRLRWQDLTPDQGTLLKSAMTGSGLALAARDRRGLFAVIYVRDMQSVSLDIGSLFGDEKELRWYDPSNGTFLDEVTRLHGNGVQEVAVPLQRNHAGVSDWVGLFSTKP